MGKPRLLYVLTASIAAPRILRGQCRHMAGAGFEVTVATGPGPELRRFAEAEGVSWGSLPLVRQPSVVKDLQALGELWLLMRRLRPDVVEVGTPKAALLGTISARLAGVPVVVHVLHGLRLETASGVGRAGLLLCERLTARLADRTVCVSRSLCERGSRARVDFSRRRYHVGSRRRQRSRSGAIPPRSAAIRGSDDRICGPFYAG